MAKFMQAVNQDVYQDLSKIAQDREITVQELVRAIIIPEWMRQSTQVEEHRPRPEHRDEESRSLVAQ